MSISKLARPEIVAMKPYSSARKEAPADGILLNANESPWSLFDGRSDEALLNRYPDPQPGQLLAALAEVYGLPPDHLLITRGSDEGIDLLTRVFCRAGQDAMLHCPPTFGMYRIAAQTQGAEVISVPRFADQDFALDQDAVLAAVAGDPRIRLIFLTSPNNPTGDLVQQDFLQSLLQATQDRAIVVVDEAYAEFSPDSSVIDWIPDYPNLVVLRTLSKAWACAGLRCGTVLAQPELIGLLGRIIAPYPLASPVTALAIRVLQADMMMRQSKLLRDLKANKLLLLNVLEHQASVLRIWPGEANFVLIRVKNAVDMLAHFAADGVILRGYRNDPELQDCIRISVGSKQDIAALESSFSTWESKPS